MAESIFAEFEVDAEIDVPDVPTTVPTPRFLPRPGTKSAIWEYFGLKKDREGKLIDDGRVFCNICSRSVSAKSGNTSNLMSHLKNNHKSVHAQLKAKSCTVTKQPPSEQPTIETSFGQCQPYQRQSKKWKELTDAITQFIAKDGLPVYTVQKDGFKSMIKRFDPKYEIPSQSHFSRTAIPALYTATKEKVAKQQSGISFFASTTDIWSSIGMKPYISFTVHFINDNWDIQSLSLSTHFLPEDHTAPVIAEALQASLKEWNLQESNQVCMTTDSGANIKAAANLLSWTRVSCFGHNLHLAVTKAINNDHRCTRAIGVAHKVVSCFSLSWKRRRELTKAQINLNLPQHSLVSVSSKLHINNIHFIVFLSMM